MSFFRSGAVPLLVATVLWLNSGEVRAACGDGALQTPDTLYGAQGVLDTSSLNILDPNTGSVVRSIGPIGFAVTGLAVHPVTGELFGTTSGGTSDNPKRGFLIHINEATGEGTVIGDLDPSNDDLTAQDITFAPGGTLFGWLGRNGPNDLASIDITTGLAEVVADSTLIGNGCGLATSDGNNLFLSLNGPNGVLRSIDAVMGTQTGSVPLTDYTGNGFSINAMDFSETGVLYASIGGGPHWHGSELATIDPITGKITVLGPSIEGLDGIAFARFDEACDDGNTVSGDGCSSDCKTIEAGFTCEQPGEPCQICGNGTVESTEICDDGNTVSGDGCSAECQAVEANFTCPPVGGPCTRNFSGEVTGGGCSLSATAVALPSAWVYLGALGGLLLLRRK